MRRALTICLSGLLLSSMVCAQDEAPAREVPSGAWGLTLDEALRIAIEQNQSVHTSRLGIPRAFLDTESAASVFDPVATGSMNFSHNRQAFFSTNPFSGFAAGQLSVAQSEALFFSAGLSKTWSTGASTGISYNLTRQRTENQFSLNPSYAPSISLTGRQPLLKGGWDDTNLENTRLAAKQLEVSQLSYKQQALETAASVEQQYYELVFGYENILVSRKVLDVAESSHVRTVSFINAGLQAPADSIDSSSFVAEARARLEISHLQLLDARDTLLSLLHARENIVDWDVQIWPIDRVDAELIPPEISVEQALEIALRNRPDFLQAEMDITSKEISLRARDQDLLPQLDLTASWTWNGLGNSRNNSHEALFDGSFYDVAIGLELSYPIFNRLARAEYNQADIDLDISKRNLFTLRQQIILEVRTGLRSLESARASLAESEAARRRAEAELDLRKTRVAAEFDTPFEVRQAEEAFVRAEATVLRARINMYQAQTELERRLGTLLDTRGVQLSYPVEYNGVELP